MFVFQINSAQKRLTQEADEKQPARTWFQSHEERKKDRSELVFHMTATHNNVITAHTKE